MQFNFDDTAKLDALERELVFRYAVYPKRVSKGLMSQYEADREIALMEAIRGDYLEKLQPRLDL